MLFFIILTMVKTDLKLTQMLFFNTLFNKIDFFFSLFISRVFTVLLYSNGSYY